MQGEIHYSSAHKGTSYKEVKISGIRSIQTEGHFGDIKGNENFRRFNYCSTDKVYKEFMLYAIGRNINTVVFSMKNLKNLREKPRKKWPDQKCGCKNPGKGFLRPKINFIFIEKRILRKGKRLTSLVLAGILSITIGDVEMWY